MLLFPRLAAMTLDSPERVKYFGLKNYHSCGICRLRKGRSVAREGTRHHPVHIENLYEQATAESHTRELISRRKRLREQLNRHGFDEEKRCRLTHHAKHCLVHVPKFAPTLFGGLCRYEAMHTYYINFCDWTMDSLSQCVVTKQRPYLATMVKSCHQFRDPQTGVCFPRLKTITELAYFTAERRVLAIFYWAHVLGLRAQVMPDRIRVHAQLAVSFLQLILITTRGHRAYTSQELDIIFRQIGRQFFMQLEAIAQYLDEKRVEKQQEKHEKNPEKNAAPKPWKPETRFLIS